jgi:hypothetical protein
MDFWEQKWILLTRRPLNTQRPGDGAVYQDHRKTLSTPKILLSADKKIKFISFSFTSPPPLKSQRGISSGLLAERQSGKCSL